MASARFPSFHFHSPVSTRRRPSDHRRAPRCHGGVGDEENQKDIVDANLTVLRARMEDLRKKERRIPLPARRGGLEFDNGWRYLSMSDGAKFDRSFDGKILKKFALIAGCLEVVTTVGGAVGLVFVGGSLGICLVALLVRHFW
ncbi:uncharacterized protein LOC120082131 isoform X1 [Benincasa hispida]|uniref:uncharacterized protein LOC120082131 isoform X1 n=1 Tax=Benincasa hispida TaxID=102211 RepID=UPI0019018C4B|nr:uncharacterized protein LOC120082131 isoform X1 [Benincasa hispida]